MVLHYSVAMLSSNPGSLIPFVVVVVVVAVITAQLLILLPFYVRVVKSWMMF